MHNPQKLHPLAYLSGFFSFIRNMIFPAILLAWNSDFRGVPNLTELSILATVLLFSIGLLLLLSIVDLINIYRTRFWIEDNKFIYKDGVLVNREKEFNIQRIDSVDISEPIYLRIFGASTLSVTTPGDGLTISVIKKTQAEALQNLLYQEKDRLEDNLDAASETIEIGASSAYPRESQETSRRPSRNLFKMSNGKLLLMAMTSGAIGTFLTIVAGFISTFALDAVVRQYFGVFETYLQNPIIALVVAIVFFVVVGYSIGTIILFVKYYNYQLNVRGDDLIVEYGLLEKKHVSVNIERVQGVVIEDSIIRRMFGFYSLSVIISTDSGLNASNNKITLLPFTKRRELYDILNDILPNYIMEIPERKVPLRAYRRFFQIQLVFIAILIGVQQYFFELPYVWIVGIAIMIVILVSGIYSARNTGFKIHHEAGEINMMSTEFFKRSHYGVKRSRIIHVRTTVHPLLKMAKLSIISLTIAAGVIGRTITLRYLHEKDVLDIWQWVERGMEADEEDIETRDYSMES